MRMVPLDAGVGSSSATFPVELWCPGGHLRGPQRAAMSQSLHAKPGERSPEADDASVTVR